MNLFFKPEKKNFAFGSFFKTDMHAHILPGLDDGAPSIDISLQLIDGLIRSGYERVIATPHIMSDHHPNTPERIREALLMLQKSLDEKGYTIQVEAAAEYMLDDHFEHLVERDDLLTFGKRFVLVETFFHSPPPNFQELLFQLQLKNYRVVLAHPERYHYVDESLEFLKELKDKGVYLQANALSFTGYYGKTEKRRAERMLDVGIIDFIGSDVHHTRHLKALEDNLIVEKVIRQLQLISNEFYDVNR